MSDIITNTTSTNDSKIFNVYVSKSTTAGTALVTRGSLKKTDTAPTVAGLYILEETGIYPNLGNIDAKADKLNFASFDGTTWSKVEVELSTYLAKAPQWVAGTYTAGSIAYDLGVTYRVKDSSPTTTERPSPTATTWEDISKSGGSSKTIQELDDQFYLKEPKSYGSSATGGSSVSNNIYFNGLKITKKGLLKSITVPNVSGTVSAVIAIATHTSDTTIRLDQKINVILTGTTTDLSSYNIKVLENQNVGLYISTDYTLLKYFSGIGTVGMYSFNPNQNAGAVATISGGTFIINFAYLVESQGDKINTITFDNKQDIEVLNEKVNEIDEVLNEKVNEIDEVLIISGQPTVIDEYKNVTSTSNGNGEIFIKNKVYEKGGKITDLTINIKSLIDTKLTSFNAVLYAVDSTNKIIVKSYLFLFNSVTIGAHTISNLNFTIPSGCRVALGIQSGISIGYGGASQTEGFRYFFNLQANWSKNTNETLSGSGQVFTTASGFGYTIYENTPINEVVNSNTNRIKVLEDKPQANNYISSKKIVATGDSMVYGHSVTGVRTWLAKLAIRNNMTYVNYGINGNRLTDTGGTGTALVNRYQDMDNGADYVIVFIGTNDAAAAVAIGDDNSIDITTFKGALNVLCDGLITKYPNKKIGFITPYLRNANYLNYVTAIETICGKYGIPVFNNIKNGGVCWTNTVQTNALRLNDSYHLNEAGMEYVSYKYEHFIRGL